jgi:hypothetical protein
MSDARSGICKSRLRTAGLRAYRSADGSAAAVYGTGWRLCCAAAGFGRLAVWSLRLSDGRQAISRRTPLRLMRKADGKGRLVACVQCGDVVAPESAGKPPAQPVGLCHACLRDVVDLLP